MIANCILTVIILGMAGRAYSEDFADLQSLRSADVKAAVSISKFPFPEPQATENGRKGAQSSSLQVGGCWTREADEEADALGLPPQFCAELAGLEVPPENPDIFDARSAILLKDEGGLRKIFITGYAKKGGDRIVSGTLFTGALSAGGRLAFAAIYLVSSPDGVLRPEMPEVRGFVLDSASMVREITYKPGSPENPRPGAPDVPGSPDHLPLPFMER